MLNTNTSFKLITRDIERSLDRVERDPTVKRELDYYLKNIGTVKTVDEFVKNDRLFRFAMKAHGLEDMTYAKAFMAKALKEGVSSPTSFANKLSDKRYAAFVETYNFARHGELATTFNRAQHDVPKNFALAVDLGPLDPGFDYVENEVSHFIFNIGGVTSIDGLLADKRLLTVALGAFGLNAATETPARVREMLEGGVSDPQSPANRLADKRYANFVTAFNFVELGAATTSKDAVGNVPGQFVANTGLNLVKPRAEFIKAEAEYYKANIGKVQSIDGLLADKRLLRVAMSAFGLNADAEVPRQVRAMLEGGVTNPESPANKLADRS